MHIPDGVLSGNVSIIGYLTSLTIYSIGFRKRRLNLEGISKISLVTSALFVASLIYIPIGVTSVHFSLVGLAGVLLGYQALYSVALALFLQMILFNHGGYTAFGINTLNFAVAAMAAHYIFSLHIKFPQKPQYLGIFALLAGGIGTVVKVLMGALSLFLSGFPPTIAVSLFVVHIPIMLGEAALVGAVVVCIKKIGKEYYYEA